MSGGRSGWAGQGERPFSDGGASRDAAEAAEPTAPRCRARVLDLIRSRGARGATDDEVEVALGLPHQTASARRRELVVAGAVEATTARRLTRSGSPATVWRAVPPPPPPGGPEQGRLF